MNRFFTLLFAASCLTAVGQVEMQLRYLTSEVHPPRSTEMSFSGANGLIDYTPLEWGGAPCGTCESSSSTDFSAPFPFGFSTNCSDVGWIFPVNGYLRFNLDSVPNSISIHTSWTGCCRATEIEIAFRQGSLWQPIDTVQYLGEGCGWQHLPFASSGLLTGCTQQDACNYNSDAQVDDGSCHFLCQFCQDGTVWDEEIQGCISANTADINNDGCVQLNDLLDLLSAYGDCGAEESPWLCGDPLEYQGYNYETVQIGEQCWFAENLRAENYRNGDVIPDGLSNPEWVSTTTGARSFYGEDGNDCNSDCDEALNLAMYGRMYNGYAIMDERGVCPQSWSVGTDADWKELELLVGMNPSEIDATGFRGVDEGQKLKASQLSTPPWNGTNEFDMNISAGSGRAWSYGTMWGVGIQCCAYYWTSTFENTGHFARVFSMEESRIERAEYPLASGMYVRCIKDAE